jgi:hypothetical protein
LDDILNNELPNSTYCIVYYAMDPLYYNDVEWCLWRVILTKIIMIVVRETVGRKSKMSLAETRLVGWEMIVHHTLQHQKKQSAALEIIMVLGRVGAVRTTLVRTTTIPFHPRDASANDRSAWKRLLPAKRRGRVPPTLALRTSVRRKASYNHDWNA